MTLRQLQEAFKNYLLHEAEGVQLRVSPAARANLNVYRNGYRRQLVSALRDTFERTWAWLGDERFDAAALEHVERCPPSDWTLNRYGGEFADTLWLLYPSDPEVRELASLEWALRRAFDGPNVPPLDHSQLAQVDWERAVITFVPTLSVLLLRTNAAAIWSAISEERQPPPVEERSTASLVRVWRDGLSPRFETVDEHEMVALGQARAGAQFSQICARLEREMGAEAAVEAATTILRSWLEGGLVAGVASPPAFDACDV